MSSTLRAGARAVALMLALLGACAEQPSEPQLERAAARRSAEGDVIMVTNLAGDTQAGSLRAALAQVTGGEIIRFAPELAGRTIVLDTVVLTTNGYSIEGPAGRGITISGGGKHRILQHHQALDTRTVYLKNLTLRDGWSDSTSGAAIRSNGTFVIENSAIVNNTAPQMAAIYVAGVTLVNSTVSGNTSTGDRTNGAILSATHLVVDNSTIAYNTGGGVTGLRGFMLRNAIVARNGTFDCGALSEAPAQQGVSIVGDSTCHATNVTRITDPKLAALADNGGPSLTHALRIESPAVNAGDACTVATDQRYVPRDDRCDIGAYEFDAFTTAALTIDPSLAVNPATGWTIATGTAQCSTDETLDVRIRVRQEVKGRTSAYVHAEADFAVACGPTQRTWSVAMKPTSGAFATGTAEASVATRGTQPWVIPATVSVAAKLFWARR